MENCGLQGDKQETSNQSSVHDPRLAVNQAQQYTIMHISILANASYMGDIFLTFPAPTGPTMAIILAFWPQLKDTFFKVSLPPFLNDQQHRNNITQQPKVLFVCSVALITCLFLFPCCRQSLHHHSWSFSHI